MASSKDIAYYTRRAEESTELARKALNPTVRTIHRKMADSYQRMAEIHDMTDQATRQ